MFHVLLSLKERKVNGKDYFQNIRGRQGHTVQMGTEESLYKSAAEPCFCDYHHKYTPNTVGMQWYFGVV